jgi:hypothetical protein
VKQDQRPARPATGVGDAAGRDFAES